jgi:hypothetical protein
MKQEGVPSLKRRTYSSERNAKVAAARTVHGMVGTREYKSWESMKDRCYRPANRSYEHYGGRGIAVCDEWRKDFAAFYRHMGPRPADTTLDRIDVNGNYEPGNCRWATLVEQRRNRTNTIVLEFRGERKAAWQWCEQIGLRLATLHDRLWRGWSVERTLTERPKSPAGKAAWRGQMTEEA